MESPAKAMNASRIIESCLSDSPSSSAGREAYASVMALPAPAAILPWRQHKS